MGIGCYGNAPKPSTLHLNPRPLVGQDEPPACQNSTWDGGPIRKIGTQGRKLRGLKPFQRGDSGTENWGGASRSQRKFYFEGGRPCFSIFEKDNGCYNTSSYCDITLLRSWAWFKHRPRIKWRGAEPALGNSLPADDPHDVLFPGDHCEFRDSFDRIFVRDDHVSFLLVFGGSLKYKKVVAERADRDSWKWEFKFSIVQNNIT